jgi:hypothetical protein
VKLTREQYQDLEQYLVEFRARLNQTTTREEAIPIFKGAVVELDKYGLLPKGMNAEKAQRLVTGWNQLPFERVLNKRQREMNPPTENDLCLLFLSATKNHSFYPEFFDPISPFALVALLAFIAICPSPYSFLYSHFPKLCDLIFLTIMTLNYKSPLRFLASISIAGDGECRSIGLKGYAHSNKHFYTFLGFIGITLLLSSDKVYVLGSTLKIYSL